MDDVERELRGRDLAFRGGAAAMTDVVARAKAALEGVTEGPWNCHDFGHYGDSEPSSIVIYAGDKFDWHAVCDGDLLFSTAAWDAQEDTDARFVCAARSLIPELVAEVEKLQGVIEYMACGEES